MAAASLDRTRKQTGRDGFVSRSAFEQLYTDTGLGDALEKGEHVFTPEIDRSLVALDRLLGKVEGGQAPDTLIESQASEDIRRLARDILRDLEALPTTPTRETVRRLERPDAHA